jgi:hydrogenase/urease accessory protein HupE
MIPKPLLILSILIGIDIILTILFVGFFGATEINPMCFNFIDFMLVKILISVVGIVILYHLRNIPMWKYLIFINILIYGGLLVFNLYNVIRFFMGV